MGVYDRKAKTRKQYVERQAKLSDAEREAEGVKKNIRQNLSYKRERETGQARYSDEEKLSINASRRGNREKLNETELAALRQKKNESLKRLKAEKGEDAVRADAAKTVATQRAKRAKLTVAERAAVNKLRRETKANLPDAVKEAKNARRRETRPNLSDAKRDAGNARKRELWKGK
jgi:hypothetical protein